MTLEGIISIAGRPGLFKVITKGKNSVIVESLIDKTIADSLLLQIL